MSDIYRAIISMFGHRNHAEFVHVKARKDSLCNGVPDLLAKGERNAGHYTTARNSTQQQSHQRSQCTLQTVNNDIRAPGGDAFMTEVFDLNDDEDTNIDRVRPHHIMDGLPVISWRYCRQARSSLEPGRAVGTDGLNAEVVQCLGMRGTLPLWSILNVTAWASTSPKTRTLSPAACLPKDHAMVKAVRHKVDGCPLVCLDATLAKVCSACLRLAALDNFHKAIRFSPLLCFASGPGRQYAEMILTAKLLDVAQQDAGYKEGF